jgi:cysteine desulfuration protein SufE
MSIEQKRDLLIEELMPFEDHLERFAYIIDRAKDSPGLDESYKIETFLIKGCISQLWVFPRFENGKCFFQADSDASITKGTATLLCELYSGETPEEVIRVEPDFLSEVGVTQHLSPNRRNGLTGVREKIKAYAQHCLDSTSL